MVSFNRACFHAILNAHSVIQTDIPIGLKSFFSNKLCISKSVSEALLMSSDSEKDQNYIYESEGKRTPHNDLQSRNLVQIWEHNGGCDSARAIEMVVWTLGGLIDPRSLVTWPHYSRINWNRSNVRTYRAKPSRWNVSNRCYLSRWHNVLYASLIHLAPFYHLKLTLEKCHIVLICTLLMLHQDWLTFTNMKY